jgi:hypothetical protein
MDDLSQDVSVAINKVSVISTPVLRKAPSHRSDAGAPADVAGHTKRPLSSRLASKQRPSRPTSTLMRRPAGLLKIASQDPPRRRI